MDDEFRPKAFITGLKGSILLADEEAFLDSHRPFGVILFARNIDTPDQVRALICDVRRACGWPVPIFIDQEGGRVQRLKPPLWSQFPCGQDLGAIYAEHPRDGIRSVYLRAFLIGCELRDLGIQVDCLPVLDVRSDVMHDVIGNRAFSADPDVVTALGRAELNGLRAAGVHGVIKHIPGHGRGAVDSHEDLPVVDASYEDLEQDFVPFRLLNTALFAMTAHIVYTALDSEAPATLSHHVVQDVIRNNIGFQGLLMTDDLSMKALSGLFEERALQAFAAGCDLVLHCNGEMDEMCAVASVCPLIGETEFFRYLQAENAMPQPPSCKNQMAARAEFQELLARYGISGADHYCSGSLYS